MFRYEYLNSFVFVNFQLQECYKKLLLLMKQFSTKMSLNVLFNFI